MIIRRECVFIFNVSAPAPPKNVRATAVRHDRLLVTWSVDLTVSCQFGRYGYIAKFIIEYCRDIDADSTECSGNNVIR